MCMYMYMHVDELISCLSAVPSAGWAWPAVCVSVCLSVLKCGSMYLLSFLFRRNID